MKNLSLRDFQQKGSLSVAGSLSEPILLTGRAGPLFFLIPVEAANLDNQYRELLRAMGQASLRNWQEKADEIGISNMTLEGINKEIAQSRVKKKGRTK